MIDTPKEFAPVCKALLVDPMVVEELNVSLGEFAAAEVPPHDRPAVKRFVDRLLGGTYSAEELKGWFDALPVGFYFEDGAGVIRLLESLRASL